MTNEELEEELRATIRRAEIALVLLENHCEGLLPTILEDLAYGIQQIVDKYCVVKEDV